MGNPTESVFSDTLNGILSSSKIRRISPMTMRAEFHYWVNYYTVMLPDGSCACCDNNDADREELESELREQGYRVRW